MRRALALVALTAVIAAGCGQTPEVVVETTPPEVVVEAAQPDVVVEVVNESLTPTVPGLRAGGFYASSDSAQAAVAQIEPGEASVSVAVEVLFSILASDG